MVTYPMNVSASEKMLIDAIRELQYGEFPDLELDGDGQPQTFTVELTRPQKELVELVRKGIRFFRLIKVHQSDPTYAQIPYVTTHGGFSAVKLYKFN